MRKLGEEPIVQSLPLWFPWVASRNGPVGQRPLTPLLLPAPPVRANSFTHHAILSRRIVPNDEHHGAAANRESVVRHGHGGGTQKGAAGGQGDTHRSVLALGTVPGRLMSRSLRLQGEAEVAFQDWVGEAAPSPTLLLFQPPSNPSPRSWGPISLEAPRRPQSRGSGSSNCLSSGTRPYRPQLVKRRQGPAQL